MFRDRFFHFPLFFFFFFFLGLLMLLRVAVKAFAGSFSCPAIIYFTGELVEKILRHIGLVRLDNATPWEVFFWLTPEILVLPSSVFIYCLCRRFSYSPVREEFDNSSLQRSQKKSKERSSKVLS
jgi:hypothetical protein